MTHLAAVDVCQVQGVARELDLGVLGALDQVRVLGAYFHNYQNDAPNPVVMLHFRPRAVLRTWKHTDNLPDKVGRHIRQRHFVVEFGGFRNQDRLS